MDATRFQELTGHYPKLRIAIVGDFCLDRYLEIDPARQETSLETGLPVHNVVRVRAQPGGAGTILNNLVALGVGAIFPIGFAGQDGEGFELWEALRACPGVDLRYFLRTTARHTFTYCKPLLVSPGKTPIELNRLDTKNWTPTPPGVQEQIVEHLRRLAAEVDAVLVLDQVDLAETGVVTRQVLAELKRLSEQHPKLTILADSRRGLRDFPPVVFKMNAAELSALVGQGDSLSLDQAKAAAQTLARANRRPVFVTLAELGILGADAASHVEHVPVLPLRGEIDIVGAGDAVSANLAAALAAGANLREALVLANAAASIVIHKLGTTGTASIAELGPLCGCGG